MGCGRAQGLSAVRAIERALRFPFVLRARARDRALRSSCPHELAVAAIFRQEAPFLDEWLTFHAGVGVTRFYLYDNFSTDDFRPVLAPWIERGVVVLHDWPVPVGQLPAYRHCVRTYADEARWIAFIDVDEFLFSPACVDIRPILAEYEDLPGLLVHSPFFGAAGHLTRPCGPLVEALTRRAPLSRLSGKTIANPRWVRGVRDVHVFQYWAGQSLDTARRPLTRPTVPVLDRLRINHYWSRSRGDLEAKVRRGDASTSAPRRLEWHLEFEDGLNAEEDRSIIPIGRAVRAAAAGPARVG